MGERKTCKACSIEKDIVDFYFKKGRDDYSNKCKICDAHGIKIPKSTTHKKCKHCGKEKEFSEFNKSGKWLQPYCIECDCKRKKKFYSDRADIYKAIWKDKYNDNRESILKRQKGIRDEKRRITPKPPRMYQRMSVEESKVRKSVNDKKYRAKNIIKLKSKKKEYRRSDHGRAIASKWQQAQKSDINFITKKRLRGRIYSALNKGVKSASTELLLGCSIEYFKKYFESLFTDGMTWDKYVSGEIHIDHRKPCKLFDLTDPIQQKVCFHYSNLQPLYKIDNLIKGIKYKEVA